MEQYSVKSRLQQAACEATWSILLLTLYAEDGYWLAKHMDTEMCRRYCPITILTRSRQLQASVRTSHAREMVWWQLLHQQCNQDERCCSPNRTSWSWSCNLPPTFRWEGHGVPTPRHDCDAKSTLHQNYRTHLQRSRPTKLHINLSLTVFSTFRSPLSVWSHDRRH